MAQVVKQLPEGLILAGQELTPAQALQAAQEHLEANYDVWTAYKAMQGATAAQAWWGGGQVGFVQAHHEGAFAVTVVNLPNLPVS